MIPAYMRWKYEADKDLVKRDAFKWTILRPGGLTNNPGTGKASVGRTHLDKPISVGLGPIYNMHAVAALKHGSVLSIERRRCKGSCHTC